MRLKNGTCKSRLEDELRQAGLPTDPKEVIDRFYRFECTHGSHFKILVGKVEAIEISDEGGFQLYVSNPTIWGDPLNSFMYSDGEWIAYTYIELPPSPTSGELSQWTPDEKERYEGTIDQALSDRFRLRGSLVLI